MFSYTFNYLIIKIPFFKISTNIIEEDDIIGRLFLINKQKDIPDLLKIENKEYIHLDNIPLILTVLSNNRLLVLNKLNDDADDYYSQRFTILDENFNKIKQVEKINSESISSIQEMTVNQENGEVHLLDLDSHRIIVTDFELNFIKYFGSRGNKDNQFNQPVGICFKNGYLYITDSGNYRIQIFNQDFEFINSLKLEFDPKQVQILNSMLAITLEDGINFYDLNSLALKFSFYHELRMGLNLSEIDSLLYGFDYKTKEVFCFESNINGNILMEKINLNLQHDINTWTGRFVVFNNSLLMSLNKEKKLIKFK